jgi:ubiquinone/menaquinone biosynthesis C-methylase UbiE
MKTAYMRDQAILAKQYQDSANLEIRRNFHKKYGTNSISFPDWILGYLKVFNGCRGLEVGCGTGSLWENAPEITAAFSELVLTDISTGMTAAAEKRFAGWPNVKVQALDVLTLPFADRSFDLVVANSMLYHVQDVDAALSQIHRVLRDDGVLYATTFGKEGLLQFIHRGMFEMGLAESKEIDDISFSLENGAELLQKHFSKLNIAYYDNHLEVSDVRDLIAYIFSMSSMSQVDRSHQDQMAAYFESKKDPNGILTIPNLSGLFICSK